jgi:hypothetical protein
MGLDYAFYAHPKTITVEGSKFSLMVEVQVSGVTYYAYQGRRDAQLSFSVVLPFSIDGKTAMQILKDKIAVQNREPSRYDDALQESGTIGIMYDDGPLDAAQFIIDGKNYDEQAFLALLREKRGSNLVFRFEPRVPHPDSTWSTYAEHLPTQPMIRYDARYDI